MTRVFMRGLLAAAAILAGLGAARAQYVYTAPAPVVVPAQKTLVVQMTAITTSGSFTPNANTLYGQVECVGGGGGGGGDTSPGTGGNSGGGGGAGGYGRAIYTKAQLAQTVTIGALGSQQGAATGLAGGTTTFGGLMSVGGGGGGQGGSAGNGSAGGAAGAAGTGTGVFGVAGGMGGAGGAVIGANGITSAFGGVSFFGGMVTGNTVGNTGGTPGIFAAGFGNGGGGGAASTSGGPVAGGSGTAGVCLVTEYILQ